MKPNKPCLTRTRINTTKYDFITTCGAMNPAVHTCSSVTRLCILHCVGQWRHTTPPQAPELVVHPGKKKEILPSGDAVLNGNFPQHLTHTYFTRTHTRTYRHWHKVVKDAMCVQVSGCARVPFRCHNDRNHCSDQKVCRQRVCVCEHVTFVCTPMCVCFVTSALVFAFVCASVCDCSNLFLEGGGEKNKWENSKTS